MNNESWHFCFCIFKQLHITLVSFQDIEAYGSKPFDTETAISHLFLYSRVINGANHPEQTRIRDFRERKFADEQSRRKVKQRESRKINTALREIRSRAHFTRGGMTSLPWLISGKDLISLEVHPCGINLCVLRVPRSVIATFVKLRTIKDRPNKNLLRRARCTAISVKASSSSSSRFLVTSFPDYGTTILCSATFAVNTGWDDDYTTPASRFIARRASYSWQGFNMILF